MVLPRAPIAIDSVESEELPPLRWRGYREPLALGCYSVGGGVRWSPGGWGDVHLNVGRWEIGIERTREED